jgi:hypothetical protein
MVLQTLYSPGQVQIKTMFPDFVILGGPDTDLKLGFCWKIVYELKT